MSTTRIDCIQSEIEDSESALYQRPQRAPKVRNWRYQPQKGNTQCFSLRHFVLLSININMKRMYLKNSTRLHISKQETF